MNETASETVTIDPVAIDPIVREAETPFRRFLSDYFESRVAVGSLFVLGVIIFIALFAPIISPTNPYVFFSEFYSEKIRKMFSEF